MLNQSTTAKHSSKLLTTTTTITKKTHQDKPQQQQTTTSTTEQQQQDDDDDDDQNDEEFDEPVWDEANLKTIQLIENKYYEDLQHISNPTKKKLQSDSSGSKTRVTSPSTINKEHEKKGTKKRRAPSHLDIQVIPESNDTINPTASQAIHHLLSQRFISLKPSSKNNGLYQRFRAKRGFLSVSDLVSCLWCEVQVEYGLLGKRYLRPSQRPKSFISSSGVTINVNTKLVVSRQNILDGGIKVHSKLEKEVAPEKVKVQVTTQVDSWGLKVMNTIVSLSLLRSTGMMREIPVWGFIGGFFIQGIVDQIELIPGPTDRSSERVESGEKCRASLIDQGDSKGYFVRISDSKTTQGETLPPPEFTESARYQLMLYKYLYDQHASGSFDLERFASHLGLGLDEPFSRTFMEDAMPVLASIETDWSESSPASKPTTLRGIFGLYQHLISQIGVSHSTLEIVYRKRGTTRSNLSAKAHPSKKIKAVHNDESSIVKGIPTVDLTIPTPVVTCEHPSLVDPQLLDNSTPNTAASNDPQIDPALLSPQKAEIQPSQNRNTSPTKANSTRSSTSPPGSTEPKDPSEKPDVDASLVVPSRTERESLTPTSTSRLEAPQEKDTEDDPLLLALSPSSSSLDSLHPTKLDSSSKEIVGAFEFLFHPLEFFGFIHHTLSFWNGDSEPVGVDIKSSNKCSPCEFKESCEWRSKLSNQIIDSVL
ncbi:hypothetical protein PGTUg99_008797 [Puccinia graminis f. sp. tritici]|uniref:Exonuclease V n=1 Tax=Puccinia graminis f. sp. tritici TaxID=56615 RepID=A0A5B0N0G8_PUCGR|nr:hypothetical protein PGTUg99_008797 [Puccinia graminis f. sp. tritici]